MKFVYENVEVRNDDLTYWGLMWLVFATLTMVPRISNYGATVGILWILRKHTYVYKYI